MRRAAALPAVEPISPETRGRLLLNASIAHRDGRSGPSLVESIGSAPCRLRIAVIGRVTELRVDCTGGGPVLECSIADDTGQLTLLFLGQTRVPGVGVGLPLLAEGTIGVRAGHLVMLNPRLTIVAE